jgi:hypothetical protein
VRSAGLDTHVVELRVHSDREVVQDDTNNNRATPTGIMLIVFILMFFTNVNNNRILLIPKVLIAQFMVSANSYHSPFKYRQQLRRGFIPGEDLIYIHEQYIF